MKTYKKSYLLSADEPMLSEIVKNESMQDVMWSFKEDYYIIHLIANRRASLLKVLKPYESIAADIRENKNNGNSLIHIAAMHATSEELFNAIVPLLDAAIEADPTLLFDCTSAGVSPVALSVKNNNVYSSRYFMGQFARRVIDGVSFKNATLSFQSFFNVKNDDGTDGSLYLLANKTIGIDPEILSCIEYHGASLFDEHTTEESLAHTPFGDADKFKASILGSEGSSSGHSITQDVAYWSLCLKALQKINSRIYVKYTKYATLYNSINGAQNIPSSDDDIQTMKHILFCVKAAEAKINHHIEQYNTRNWIKRYSKNHAMINNQTHLLNMYNRLGKASFPSALVPIIIVFGLSMYYIGSGLTRTGNSMDDANNKLEMYPDCVYRDYERSFCFGLLDECDDQYLREIEAQCQSAENEYSHYRFLMVILFISLLASPIFVATTVIIVSNILVFTVKAFLDVYDAINGLYNLNDAIKLNQDEINAHLLLLNEFDGILLSKDNSNDLVAEPIALLSKPIEEITEDDLDRVHEVLNQLIPTYVNYVKYLPASDRLSLENLATIIKAYSASTLLNAPNEQIETDNISPNEREMMPLVRFSQRSNPSSHVEMDLERGGARIR